MTSKGLNQRPSNLINIDPDSDYERFEFDQAVTGLGRYVDGKLEQLHPKTLKPVYPTLESVLNLAKSNKAKDIKKHKAVKSAPPPTFRRRKKKK